MRTVSVDNVSDVLSESALMNQLADRRYAANEAAQVCSPALLTCQRVGNDPDVTLTSITAIRADIPADTVCQRCAVMGDL